MKDEFVFRMPVRILCGAGSTKRLTEEIPGNKILMVCDPFLYENGTAQEIGDSLAGKAVQYFSGIEPNPSCESVDEAAAQARSMQADCVIGLGGGSAMDVAKIVACLVTNEGSIYDYYSGGTRTLQGRKTFLVLIPTTSGTGSEVTNVGVFTNRRIGVKMPMLSDCFWADLAVLEPELTYSMPPAVTASTGMDAFCHAIEAYWNKRSQPICDMLALGAMKLVLSNIKKAYDSPMDAEARVNMLHASLIAGMAFSQTWTTGVHAISFPLTTEYHASHGVACAITLPAFIRLCDQECHDKLLSLANDLGYATVPALADGVEALMASMGMPVRLHQLGVGEENLAHIAQVGLSAANSQLTPAIMNEETVCALLKSIL